MTTFLILAFLVILIIAGYFWSEDHKRQTATHAEHDAMWAEECLRLLAMRDSAEADVRSWEITANVRRNKIRHLARENERLRANLVVSEGLHADSAQVLRAAQVELDEHAKRFALPTITGMRADLLDRIAHLEPGEVFDALIDDELKAVIQGDALVLPMKKKGGKR